MKRLLILILMAAGLSALSCKKGKKPAPETPGPVYDGTPNAVSGVWMLNVNTVSSIAPMVHNYGFGTNFLYQKTTGTPDDKKIEKGSYTLTPVAGTPGAFTLQLRPGSGTAYTINVTELTGNQAIFELSAPSYTKFGYVKIAP